jgi:hypothetical protein
MSPRIFLVGVFGAGALLSVGCGTADFPSTTPDAGPVNPGDPDAGTGEGPTVLPFAVDDYYGPSGYMGDGESPGGIKDDTVCLSPRPAEWLGNCHQFTWTPGSAGWGGVFWQYPDGNWGNAPGLTIPTGATKVTFKAWGATGGEVVEFGIGMKAIDGFEVKSGKLTLTTEPTEYTLELAGTSYVRVVGGFSWAADTSTTAVTFNVDDIRWQ